MKRFEIALWLLFDYFYIATVVVIEIGFVIMSYSLKWTFTLGNK